MSARFTHITASAPTTTVCQSTPGTLHKIIINKATASAVITVYDGTAAQADTIAIITVPATVVQSQVELEYNVAVKRSVTVVTSTASCDLTVTTSGPR